MIPAEFQAGQHIRPKSVLNGGCDFLSFIARSPRTAPKVCTASIKRFGLKIFSTQVETQLVVELIGAVDRRNPFICGNVGSIHIIECSTELQRSDWSWQRGTNIDGLATVAATTSVTGR